MKIRTLVLGEYGVPPVVFGLHLFPAPLTPPLTSPPSQGTTQENYFLCVEDLEALFFSKKGNNAKDLFDPSNFYRDQKTGRSYVMAREVADVATKLGLDNLVDLCRLTEYDVFHGATDELLSRIENLNSCKKSVIEQELTVVRKDTVSPIIRLSPPEDTTRRDQVRFDPCRDAEDKRRLSSSFLSDDQQQQQQPKPSSLLLKRLAPRHGQKAPRNLTIFTPSYAGGSDQSSRLDIHSAPLHPRGGKHNPHTLQPLQHRNRIQKVTTTMKKTSNLRAPPATAAPWPTQQSEFPSPPIVPSQQRYPTTQQQAKAASSIFPKTPLPPPPSTAHPLSKKQQFLQPFEMLYDTLEQTRTLKSTLDDQIRRSSSMMQSLQSSSAFVERLVRQQVQEMMQQQFEKKLKDCATRIEWLEEQQQQQQHQKEKDVAPIQTPASSSNEERSIKDMLAELVNRLDQLENKMDTRP